LSGNSKISEDLMDYHYGWGVTALAVLMVTGAVAFHRVKPLSTWNPRATQTRERGC
jgi:hypothetical protein